MRLLAAVSLVVLGCAAPPVREAPLACPPMTSLNECDAPPVVDPTAVHDRDAFIAAASALVCEWGLTASSSGWGAFEQSYCAPGFFAVDAHREGVGAMPTYDEAAARACLAALLVAPGPNTAFDVATSCRAIALGFEGRSCRAPGATCPWGTLCVDGACHAGNLGESCTFPNSCAAGLWCALGGCAPVPAIGDACASDDACGLDLGCVDGHCTLVVSWRDGGACCTSDGDCLLDLCVRGHCAASRPHLGCACESDLECPLDVSRCVAGVCTSRPMPGDACTPAGVPCFGSVCGTTGVCHLGALGEGPCRASSDCQSGLVCNGGFLSPPGICVVPP